MLKVIFLGNLGSDPEERYTQAGARILSFSVAVNERKRQPNSDEWVDKTNWFRVRVMGRQCDYVSTLNKGNRVQVIGNLSVDTYQGREGDMRVSLDVFADEVNNLTPRDGAKPGEDWQPQGRGEATVSTAGASRPVPANAQQQRVVQRLDAATDLEDLPFRSPRWIDEPWLRWRERL